MAEAVDITKVRRNALRAASEDGVAELLVGFALLVMGAALMVRWPVYAIPVIVLIVPIKQALRRRVSQPRVGYAEASGPQLRAMAPWFVVAFLALVAGVGLVIVSGDAHPRPWPARLVPLAAMLMIAAPFFGLARLTGLGRFAALAALAPACGLACALAMPEAGIPAVGAAMLAFGAIATVMGVVSMARFVATHPRLGGEGDAE